MRTERLYYQDPWLHHFDAQVIAVTRGSKRFAHREGRLPPGIDWQTAVRALLDGD